MNSSIACVTGAILCAASASFAQSWCDNCSLQRCTSLDTCEAVYERCFQDAHGDPSAEAVCAQQRDACRTSADDAFVSCAQTCCNPCNLLLDPCIEDCEFTSGDHFARCEDGYLACVQAGFPPEHCRLGVDACNARVYQELLSCLRQCATPCALIPVLPQTWTRVKQLYRD